MGAFSALASGVVESGGIDPAIQAVITSGLSDSKTMIVTVIGICFGGIVAIILASGGANFALRKIRSVFNWA